MPVVLGDSLGDFLGHGNAARPDVIQREQRRSEGAYVMRIRAYVHLQIHSFVKCRDHTYVPGDASGEGYFRLDPDVQ